MNPNSNRNNAGLGGLPMLFPDANKLNPDYYAYEALNKMNPAPPAWVNGDFLKPPTFAWGNRVGSAPPNLPFPVVLQRQRHAGHLGQPDQGHGASHDQDRATSTRTATRPSRRRTTSRSGTLNFQQDTVGTNPFDTSYGFANAAIGAFSSYLQASNYVEGNYVYDNREAYIQDNWRVNNRLTLDYGMRFVNAAPQYDKLGQAIQLPAREVVAGRGAGALPPGLRRAQAPGTACPAASQQALNPLTGQLLGPNSSLAIGTLVPNSGSLTNGLVPGRRRASSTRPTRYPTLAFAPRFGMAYDLTGKQKIVLRGGVGLFYDRPFGNTVICMAGNPPSSRAGHRPLRPAAEPRPAAA